MKLAGATAVSQPPGHRQDEPERGDGHGDQRAEQRVSSAPRLSSKAATAVDVPTERFGRTKTKPPATL